MKLGRVQHCYSQAIPGSIATCLTHDRLLLRNNIIMQQFIQFALTALFLCGTYGCATFSGEYENVPLPPAAQIDAMKNEGAKEYLTAYEYWKHAEHIVDERLFLLAAHLEEISRSHSEKGEAYYLNREGEEALKEFLEALRYNPSNKIARKYLKTWYMARESVPYTIQQGDTFASIAVAVYGSELDTFAVSLFSGVADESQLVAGSTINLPLLNSFYSQALLDYKRDILVARTLFKEKQYGKLLPLVEKILKNHPGDKEASYLFNSTLISLGNELKSEEKFEKAAEMLSRVDPVFKDVSENIQEIRELQHQKMERDAERLNSELFRKGETLFTQRKYLEALEVFQEIDPDFEGIEKIITNVKEMMRMQADIHYKRGVTFFVEDNLAAAIREWEKTLSYEPDHEKAKSYIVKASKLLEKVKAIDK